MPIKIPDELPARLALEAEGVVVMRQADAMRQDIRPLRIGLLNLMPNKISTETQLARLLGATPLQVELTLVRMTEHISRNTSADHMKAFYRPWTEICEERFDGFIITGAPLAHIPFEQVNYWDEFCRVLDWTQTHVHSCLTLCWAAQAALHYFHKIPRHLRDRKAFGVFRHRNLAPSSPYLRGFSDDFCVPVSALGEIIREDIPAGSGLAILADSVETGLCLLDDPKHRALHVLNHFEYDTGTLNDEYLRDGAAMLPENYFPEDDPGRPPENRWRGHAHLLFGNWVNQIYQTAPFDVAQIGVTPSISDAA